MKKASFYLGIVFMATLTTHALMAYTAKRQQQRVNLSVTIQEAELIMEALSELPLKKAGPLYMNLQEQAQRQLMPMQKPKADSTSKPKKP